MTDRIEPALTAEQWAGRAIQHGSLTASVDDYGSGLWFTASGEYEPFSTQDTRSLAAIIALANAALPESDPRKITREMVNMLREEAARPENVVGSDEVTGADVPDPFLSQISDVLESYLPPA